MKIWSKKVEKRLKKMFRPTFGCAQHPKAGRNTQLSWLWPYTVLEINRPLLNHIGYYKLPFPAMFLLLVWARIGNSHRYLWQFHVSRNKIMIFFTSDLFQKKLVFLTISSVSMCYKLIQLFRVTCFIAGQYNTGLLWHITAAVSYFCGRIGVWRWETGFIR